MADPVRPVATKQRMLEVAFDLFHAKGIHATSVDEILERSGTGKSQFYHYFGSKDGIIQAVVERFERRMQSGELPGPEVVRNIEDLATWFSAFLEFQRASGCVRSCPMATIAGGLGDEQEPIRAIIQRIFAESRGVLVRFFAEMLDQQRIAGSGTADELADFCYAIMHGGLIVSCVQRDPAPFEHAIKHALSYVRSLLL